MMLRIATLLWCALLAVFLAVTAYYIVFHHVSPMSRDQWHMLHALFEKGLWQTSISTVSGHRHLLAFVLYEIDLQFFAGRNHFLVAVDWLLNLSLVALLCSQIIVCVPDRRSRWLLCGWVVVLLCWLLNIALLGWGFNGINNYLSVVSCVLSIFFLYKAVHLARHAGRNFILALLLGGLCTLSFGNGVLVWPLGLLSLYLWRAPRAFHVWFGVAAALFVALYFLLPGGDAAEQMLLWPGWNILRFPVQVMGGPFYHLLRAWRVLPEPLLLQVMSVAGALITLASLRQLWELLKSRTPADVLEALAVALIGIGFGSALMLTLARVDGVLDATTDRFQIWALLPWLGLGVLYFRRAAGMTWRLWSMWFFVFPILALPSQLDWGARLAEYRTRVDNALLSYQVYLPVAEDAEKALHWNWQNKLPHLFPVLEQLRAQHRNVFANGQADWLGRVLPDSSALPRCALQIQQRNAVRAGELLDVRTIAGAGAYVALPSLQTHAVAGWRWQLQVDEPLWDYGVITDQQSQVRGLLQPVQHSRLPRFSGVRHDSYNAYGVVRSDGLGEDVSYRLLLFRDLQPFCARAL